MDWKQLISELAATGLTQTQIAVSVGVRQSAISDLSTGAVKDPMFTTGQKLRDLHRRKCKPRKTSKEA